MTTKRFILDCIVCSILSLVVAVPSKADSGYSFVLLNPVDGFPAQINSVYTEYKGLGWLCSEDGLYRLANGGVNRYDTSSEYGPCLPGNDVYQAIRYDGILWVLTDGGLVGFSDEYGTFFTGEIKCEGVTAHSAIECGDGLFFGGKNTVFKYNAESKQVEVFARIPVNGDFTITGMHLWKDGSIVLFDKSGKDIWSVYPKTGLVNRFEFQSNDPDHKFSQFLIDKSFNIWTSRHNQGVERYNSDGKLIRTYNTGNSGLSKNIVLCFMENDEEMWVGTDGGGINRINRTTGQVIVMCQDLLNPFSLPGTSISFLYKGINGIIWAVRPRGGVMEIRTSYLTALPTSKIPGAVSEGIESLYQEPDGTEDNVWIGTDGTGLLSFDPKTETLTSYPSTRGHNIFAITGYTDGKLLLSCESEGMFTFDKRTHSMQQSTLVKELNYGIYNGEHACINKIGKDYVVALSDLIYVRNLRTMEVDRLPLPAGTEPGTLHFTVNCEGKFLFDKTHVFKWDNPEASIIPILDLGENASISSASMSYDGIIWMINGEHIVTFDPSTGVTKKYETDLISQPQSLVCAKDGHIWIGSKSVVYALNPENGHVAMLDSFEGTFDNEYLPHARLVDNEGNVYLGGLNGVVKIGTDYPLTSEVIPDITPLEVFLDGKEITDLNDVRIIGQKNSVTVHIFAKEMAILRKRLYRFKLEGPSDMIVDRSVPSVTFNNLSPGRYSVSASCTSKEGEWTDYTKVFDFKVARPWNSSIWFWSFIGLVIAAAASALFGYRLKRKRLEVEKERQDKLILAEEERLNFLADISHELRTPLTLVLGPIERLIRRNEDIHPSELVGIFKNAERIKVLLNTILTAQKIESGRSGSYFESHNINRWVKNLVSNFETEAGTHDIVLATELDPRLGNVDIDASKCYIVLSNLLLNAIKISPDETTITISTKDVPGTDSFRISVTDMGPGVDNQLIDSIFNNEYAATEDRSGLGVGLSYSKSIINRLNGSVGVHNNPEGGATFFFELPKLRPESEPGSDTNVIIPAKSGKTRNMELEDSVILIVEDDQEVRRYLKSIYKPISKDVLTASNGKEALKVVKTKDVDIVVSDIMMPEMNGLLLCKKLKTSKDTCDIPVILLSARSDETSIRAGLGEGADTYITKPFDIDKLTQSIRDLLKK